MREDYWTNSKTNTELGVTGPLGSPRAWLRRAFDTISLDDMVFQPGALTPYEISVGAVWYRPCQLPESGNHRTLYRFFDIATPADLQRNIKRENLYPAIGIAAAVPINQVMAWIAQAKNSGATYTWWKTPSDKSVRASVVRPQRRQLDHNEVYKLLDAGLTRSEIAAKLEYPVNNIDYVFKKWEKGLHLVDRKPFLNVDEIFAAHRSGVSVREISEIHNTSPAYVYRMLGRYRQNA